MVGMARAVVSNSARSRQKLTRGAILSWCGSTSDVVVGQVISDDTLSERVVVQVDDGQLRGCRQDRCSWKAGAKRRAVTASAGRHAARVGTCAAQKVERKGKYSKCGNTGSTATRRAFTK
jgi:hypothetical protein